MKKQIAFLFSMITLFVFSLNIEKSNSYYGNDNKLGEKLFFANCNACHKNGANIIIPEKNLKKEALEANGMDNLDSIIYQVINGKNGMPAFGNRLKENEINEIAKYVLEKSIINFEK